MSEQEKREGREEEKKKEEEERRTYIDPNNLEIFVHSNQWRPSRRQILVYALKIGYDPMDDPKEFLEIAEKSLMKPLPKNWIRAFREENFELLYIDLITNEMHIYTEIEEKAKAELIEKRAIYEEQCREKNKEENKGE